MLSTFLTICAAAVDSRYPYEDSYAPGDIVPNGNARYPYGRDTGYARRQRGGLYGGALNRRHRNIGGYIGGYTGGYGVYRDDALQDRNYRRRNRDYDTYLPPRGIGGYNKPYPRSIDYEYERRRRPKVVGPPRYYDEDEFNDGGYRRGVGKDIGYD